MHRLERLVSAVQELSLARSLPGVIGVVRDAARELTGADGATFILRDHGECFYADESAISPLWKGRRFPLETCISGWAMLNRAPAVIPDIYVDPRIPIDAYRPTFVKSLAMVPIRTAEPIGAIGNYWASHHAASDEEVRVLQALADSASVAMENVRLYEELERRVQQREEFIEVAAHELRTPLASLQLNLQMLRPRAAGPNLDLALNAGKRISELLEALLDASVLSDNPLSIERAPVNLADLANQAARRIAHRAHQLNCKLSVQAESVPGAWDEKLLLRALGNLLSNAIKFGAGKPVTLTVSPAGPGARMVVTDRGPGIGEADAARIFEAFGRKAPLRNYGGFGVGLYLTRRIIEAHGGTIRVQSDGQTSFIVELPLS